MGTVAVLAGALALCTAKGSQTHRLVGNIFFMTMVAMALAGIYLAVALPMAISVLAGVFTIYLVATPWMAARRADGVNSPVVYLALATALGVAVGGLALGLEADNGVSGLKDGLSSFPHYFFAGLELLAAAGDLNLIVRRGISGKHRIARHLWRMCLPILLRSVPCLPVPAPTSPRKPFEKPGCWAFPSR